MNQHINERLRKPRSFLYNQDMEIRDHALLYALIVRACIQYRSEKEGSVLAEKITVSYGRKRGYRMRLLAEENGEKADMNSFLIHGEWKGRPHENESVMRYGRDNTESAVRRCAWYETWKKYGLLEYGKHYCRSIDRAIAQGFGGGFELISDGTLSEGSEECRFLWTAAADERYVREQKEKADGRWILPFEFHCRELLETASRFLPADIIEEIRYEYRKQRQEDSLPQAEDSCES